MQSRRPEGRPRGTVRIINGIFHEALEGFKRERLVAEATPVACGKILGTMKRLLDHAVRRTFLEHNPVSSVRMPRGSSDPIDEEDIVSMLLDLGKPEKYIQEQLGHSNDLQIRKVYGHLMRNRHPEHAKDHGGFLFGKDD